MDDPPFPPANVEAVPAADVTAPPAEKGSVVHHAYPLRKPEEDANDIVVQVRGSILRKVRARLGQLATRSHFPWVDLSLGAATLCFGGVLGAIASGLPWAAMSADGISVPIKAIIFYVVLPIIGTGSGVAHVLLRQVRMRDAEHIAEDILADLPDPDRTL